MTRGHFASGREFTFWTEEGARCNRDEWVRLGYVASVVFYDAVRGVYAFNVWDRSEGVT